MKNKFSDISHLTPKTLDWSKDISQWIKEVCDANKVQELANRISWIFSKRMNSLIGFAKYSDKTITFSYNHWDKISQNDRHQWTIHETCHIIAYEISRGKRIKPHGEEWVMCMKHAGATPQRCHDFGVAFGISVNCDCGNKIVTKNLANKLKKGAIYRCNTCHKIITLKEKL